jgi:hypothetical protein
MKFAKSLQFAFATVFFGISGASASIFTATQTTTFNSNGDFSSTSLDGLQLNVFFSEQILGLNKFDPSLGTLLQVFLTVQIDGQTDYSLTVFNSFDEPFSAEYSEGANDFAQAGITYRPGNSAFGFAVTVDSAYLPSALGGTDLGIDSLNEIFVDGDVFGAFALEGLASEGTIASGDAEFFEPDFVGIGEIDTLFIEGFVDLVDGLFVENVDGGEIEAGINLNSGDVTLQYFYEPVPEPASYAMILGGLALALSLVRRRVRQGVEHTS